MAHKRKPVIKGFPERKRVKRAASSLKTLGAPSRLLALPRELRDAIYHLLWQGVDDFAIDHNNLSYKFVYQVSESPSDISVSAEGRALMSSAGISLVLPQPPEKKSIKVPWIFVSKQLQRESIEQYQRLAVSKLKIAGSNSTLPIWNPRCLLAPWNGQSLELEIDAGVWEEMDNKGRAQKCAQLRDRPVSWLKKAGERMRGASLQQLKVRCNFRAYHLDTFRGADLEDIRVDFGPLERLRTERLKRAELTVDLEFVKAVQDIGLAERPLREEIIRLGRSLLQHDLVSFSEEDERSSVHSWVWKYVFVKP